MGKIVAGQLKIWEMAKEFSAMSNSFASKTMRVLVDAQVLAQRNAPDVLPSSVTVKPMIEAETGKIFSDFT